jgi:two-component system response regulator PilR (NtrC family)
MQERILQLLDSLQGPIPFLISTASDSLERLSAGGHFLPELFHRLSAYRISIPPLRERIGDIPDLFQAMVVEAAAEMAARAPEVDSRAARVLLDYSWPGNLRELHNVARVYLLLPDAGELEREIERRRGAAAGQAAPVALKHQVREASKRVEGEIILRTLEHHRWNRRRTAEALRISYRSLLYKMKSCEIRGDSGLRRSMAQ